VPSGYEILEVKGQRVVRRRKATVQEEARNEVAPKTMTAEEPRVQRVVKRKLPAAVVAEIVAEVEAAEPARKRGRPKKVAAPVVAAKPKKPKKQRAATTSVKAAYPSGQNGPAVELAVDELNDKERKVVDTLNGAGRGERPELTIAALGSGAFPKQAKPQGMSWVRNSLRRLVRAGYVERCKRGAYRVTDTGRRRLSKAA